VKGKGKEGEAIIQEPIIEKNDISTNEVDNKLVLKAIPI